MPSNGSGTALLLGISLMIRINAEGIEETGTIQYELPNLAAFKEFRGGALYNESAPVKIRNNKWSIVVAQNVDSKGNMVAVPDNQQAEWLGFFVRWDDLGVPEETTCTVSGTMTVVSQQEGVSDFTRPFQHTFSHKSAIYGYYDFKSYSELLEWTDDDGNLQLKVQLVVEQCHEEACAIFE